MEKEHKFIRFLKANKKTFVVSISSAILGGSLVFLYTTFFVLSLFEKSVNNVEALQGQLFGTMLKNNEEGQILVDSIIAELNKIEISASTREEKLQLEKIQESVINEWIQVPSVAYENPAIPDKPSRRYCSTVDPGRNEIPRTSAFARYNPGFLQKTVVEVPIVFHLIRSNQTHIPIPDVTNKIDDQLDTLNNAFRNGNITFTLDSVITHTDSIWYNFGFSLDSVEVSDDMTSKSSIDPKSTLNVYLLKGSGKWLGEASFPWWPENGTHHDVVKIYDQSLPGSSSYFDEGNTLIHEVGHYLGLYHTFHYSDTICWTENGVQKCEEVRCQDQQNYNGCDPLFGDLVDDTPAQRYCHFCGCGGCEGSLGCCQRDASDCLDRDCVKCQSSTGCDTCSGGGNDPVTNYMGYNPDDCMNEFTAGQYRRMKQVILKHRKTFIKPT